MEQRTLFIRKVEYNDISQILHGLCWKVTSKSKVTKEDPKQKHQPHEYYKVVVERDESLIKDLDKVHKADEDILRLLAERDEQPQRYIRPLFDKDKRTILLSASALAGLVIIIIFLVKLIKSLGESPVLAKNVIINTLLILIGLFLIGMAISGVFDTIQIQKNMLEDNKKIPSIKVIDTKIHKILENLQEITNKYWEESIE